jgi:hypothetical protein
MRNAELDGVAASKVGVRFARNEGALIVELDDARAGLMRDSVAVGMTTENNRQALIEGDVAHVHAANWLRARQYFRPNARRGPKRLSGR